MSSGGGGQAADGQLQRSTTAILVLPGNDYSYQLASYLSAVRDSVDFRYNLAWTFGDFLQDVPQRLGSNRALDAAAAALISAHANVCCNRPATPQTLSKYSRALYALKETLNDPCLDSSSESLCSVMLLLICQVSGV